MKTFEESKNENIQSGSIKFDQDYVSSKQVFSAVQKWIEDDKNVILASLRNGGPQQVALDFKYDISNQIDGDRGGVLLNRIIKPYFKDILEGDYIVGWDFSSPTYVVK